MATLKLQLSYIFRFSNFFPLLIFCPHIHYWTKCTKQKPWTLLKACFPAQKAAFKCLSPVSYGQACSAKTQSYHHRQLCGFKHGSTQITNSITASIKIDYSFSTRHPSNTLASTHGENVCSWASQFPFPAGITELLRHQLHHTSAALIPPLLA